MKTTTETIREFLALPSGALPSATWDEDGDAWRSLRDYVADEQEIDHLGEEVILRADRDGWRDGVRVVLS